MLGRISNTFVPAVHIVLLYEYGNLRLYKPFLNSVETAFRKTPNHIAAGNSIFNEMFLENPLRMLNTICPGGVL